MRVQPILVGPNEYNYLLIGSDGLPIEYVTKYMKYLHSTQKAPETRRTYYMALRSYYTFLELEELTFADINVKVLSDYMIWLISPDEHGNVTGMGERTSLKNKTTINLYITTVLSYYRFLFVMYESELNLDESVYFLKYGPRKYKDFLYHVTKSKPFKKGDIT